MTTERITERKDGEITERVVERDMGGATTVVQGGPGIGGILIGVAALALVLIIGFFLMNASRNNDRKTEAVTSAVSDVADSTAGAVKSVGDAAESVGDAAENATKPKN
ncbi:hypothetical protein [Phenylobacterium sp.]|jgi:hypothetical protein|uniref:hypothetical protein n=1 Tax=Phenylobacterium sp. TaxID=1871053 RepID=UPI002E34353C|nr:hypothetical protein [Phenylobacterium sp.]HEX2559624.1 hypothetical protein [Phenylobacterium sp.]